MNLEKIFSKSEAKWQLHSHVRLCGPMDCGPPGSPVHGVLQARTLEWVAMSFSRVFPTQGLNPGLLCSGRFFTI